MSNRSLLDYLTNDYNDEYILNIDENGKSTKIPYNPFDECTGEEYYKKLIKKKKDQEKRLERLKKKIIKDNPNFIEVEKIEEADHVILIHKDDIRRWSIRVNDQKDMEVTEMLEKDFDVRTYFLKTV